MNERDKLIALLESSEGAVYWNSEDKNFVEKIADYLIANGVTMAPQWISVEERLPEIETHVLVYDGDDISIMTYRSDRFRSKGFMYLDDCGYWVDGLHITHWMALPSVEGLKNDT